MIYALSPQSAPGTSVFLGLVLVGMAHTERQYPQKHTNRYTYNVCMYVCMYVCLSLYIQVYV